MSRKSIVVILSVNNNIPSIHFCNHPALSGVNSDLWFPIGSYSANPMDLFRAVGHSDLFRAIEDVMTINYSCHNVVSIKQILELTSTCIDFEVVYNKSL
ncbi:hypothetical protein ABLA30_03945 [Xenorhabdus nematophila]|uniref:hypothetical protein n=1 Tax=Xenorhabdus nematophila TaxID=628 RepID=UPI0032B7E715